MTTPLSLTPSSVLSITDWLSTANLVPLRGDWPSHFPDNRFLHNSVVHLCFLSSTKILIILPLSQSISSLPTRLSAPSPTNVWGDSIRTISDVCAVVKTGSSRSGTDERGKCDNVGLSAACPSNEATIRSVVVVVV